MNGLKRCWFIMKRTGTAGMLFSFIVAICVVSAVLWVVEPQIHTFTDGVWYCFVASTTIGFGDIYAVTGIGRILTAFIAVYGIMTVAMIPGVIVSYYLDYIKIRDGEILASYREKLENLPELSEVELKDISEKIKKIR